jgi:hypothetical protein
MSTLAVVLLAVFGALVLLVVGLVLLQLPELRRYLKIRSM